MTNSQASVIRPRRLNPRVFLVLAFMIVAVSVPVALLSTGTNFSGLFSQVMPRSGTQHSKIEPAAAPVKPAPTVDAAGYLKALDQASRSLADQIQKNPSDPSLQNRLGLIYLNLGDMQGAEQCFSNAVTLCRGALSECSGRIEKSRVAGRIKEASNEVLKASGLSVELAAAHSNLARVYDQVGDRQKVVAELELLNKDGQLFQGASLGSGSLKVKDGRLTPLEAKMLGEAEACFHSNRIAQAVAEYKKLLSMNPKLSLPHERLGLIAAAANDTAGAIDEFEAAARLEPSSGIIQNNLGMAYSQMGMNAEAERAFLKAVALDPSLDAAAVNLGNLLSASGRIGEATTVLRQAARANPKSAHAQNNLATFLALNGKDQEAISCYHKAIKVDPTMASAYYGMGVALMHTHQYLPAIRQLKQALALNPRLIEAQTKIEEAYRLAGRRS